MTANQSPCADVWLSPCKRRNPQLKLKPRRRAVRVNSSWQAAPDPAPIGPSPITKLLCNIYRSVNAYFESPWADVCRMWLEPFTTNPLHGYDPLSSILMHYFDFRHYAATNPSSSYASLQSRNPHTTGAVHVFTVCPSNPQRLQR